MIANFLAIVGATVIFWLAPTPLYEADPHAPTVLVPQRIKFISQTGHDLYGNGSSTKPYKTLRYAIRLHGGSYAYLVKEGKKYRQVYGPELLVTHHTTEK